MSLVGNKYKNHQSSQTQMNDYERSRMLRVQENKQKLLDLGVKNITKSLTSLVESKNSKKKKDKKKIATNEKVVEYNSDLGDDNEETYEEEVARSVEVPKKQRHPQYIAPMSINKYANSKQRRVIAPNFSRMLASEEICKRNGHVVDSHVKKNSRLQQSEKGGDRNGKLADTNVAKHNQSRTAITMGELILNKKGTEKQRGVSKQNSEKTNSVTRRVSSGTKRKLILVDNVDDGEDAMRSQDENEVNIQQYDAECDENDDDIEQIISEISGKGAERDDIILMMTCDYPNQIYIYIYSSLIIDVNETSREEDDAHDDEIEDIDQMIFDNNIQYEIEGDNSDDDTENGDYESVEEQLEGPESEKENEAAISTMKKRGPTMMHDIHVRKSVEREVIICNEFGQPVGPITAEKDIVGRFSRFLGTIARNYKFASLTHNSWRKVPHKERIWEYVQEKYIVPENAKDWVLMSIGACWRGFKCRIKNKHFYKFKDNKSRWTNRPECIPKKDFFQLLGLWNNKEVTKRCLHARERRLSQKNTHTAGPKSFARIREEMKNEDPDKNPPNLTKLFERTRKRKEGNVYVDTYDDTEKKLELMKNYKTPEDGSVVVDPFLAVMNKEYDGHRRLFGRGVTNKLIKKVNGGDNSYMVSRELMESFVDMKKDFEADHERKMIELAEEHEKKKAELEVIQKDIDIKRDKIVEDVLQMIMEKLPPGVIREFLS